MSQQQHNFDLWTNLNQSPWTGDNALVVARARTEVLSRFVLIFHAKAQLEDAMAARETPVRVSNRNRPFSTSGKNGDYFNNYFDATAFAVKVNNI